MDENTFVAARGINGVTEAEPETIKLESGAAASSVPAMLCSFVEQRAEASNASTGQKPTESKPGGVGAACLIAASSEEKDLAEPVSGNFQAASAAADQTIPQENGRRVRRKTHR